MNKSICTLTDKELANVVELELDKLIKTGGNSFVMRVPANPNKDTDLVIAELLTRFRTTNNVALNLFGVSGWLEFYGNEKLFNEMAKKNCPCRFEDGTQKRYNEEHPKAMLTHFKLV